MSSVAANVSDAEYRRYSTFLQGAAPKLWPAPKEGMWLCLLSTRKKNVKNLLIIEARPEKRCEKGKGGEE